MLKKKMAALGLAGALVLGIAGGTYAYLQDTTDAITNTFTVGKVDIDLTEPSETYHIVPGKDITKSPKVTVKANSETAWVFVKLTPSADFTTIFGDDGDGWAIASGWTALDGHEGVYYREYTKASADTDYTVLKDNKVTPLTTSEPTSDMTVTLAVKAYAIQKEGNADAATAWTNAQFS